MKRLHAFALALKCIWEFNLSRTLKSEQKEAISILVSGKELLAVLPNAAGFWKSLIFQAWVLMKEIDGKPSGVVVICRLQRIVYDQME